MPTTPPHPGERIHDGEQTAERVGAAALQTTGLSKRYGSTVAVADLRLQIPRGSFYGLVGPNGAGKTTALSMMTGLLRPDAGRVHLGSTDVWAAPAEAKRLMGVLSDNVSMFHKLTGEQLVTYAGLLRGLRKETVGQRVNDLLRVLGLQDAAGTMVEKYSTGMRKKIHLATALVHAPPVLVLDEPFESVDPVSARTIQNILESYVSTGGTVIMSSHVMELIQRICTHVGVIDHGALQAAGTVDEVSGDADLESAFAQLVGATDTGEELEWLRQ